MSSKNYKLQDSLGYLVNKTSRTIGINGEKTMKFCLIHIVLILTVFPASIYGGWLDEFYETQEYANETFKYLKGSSGKTSDVANLHWSS